MLILKKGNIEVTFLSMIFVFLIIVLMIVYFLHMQINLQIYPIKQDIFYIVQNSYFSMDINDLQTKTVINKINLSTFESNGSFSFVDEEAEFINRNIKLQIISSDPETVVAVGDGYYTEYDHNISVYNIEAVQELSEGTYDLIINDGAVEKSHNNEPQKGRCGGQIQPVPVYNNAAYPDI